MSEGKVKWFDNDKGYGFLQPDDGDRDLFVHYSKIVGDGYKQLEVGDRVSFEQIDTDRGPQAVEVVKLP